MGIFAQFAQSYDTGYSSAPEDAALTAVVAGFVFLFVVSALLISYAVYAFLLGRIFKKAGVEQWIAWVPLYNNWKMLELGGQQGFWAVLAIVPIVNIVSAIFMYIAMYNIGLKLQKEGWFVVIAIFFTIIWMGWLAFDGSRWSEKGGAAPTPKTTVDA